MGWTTRVVLILATEVYSLDDEKTKMRWTENYIKVLEAWSRDDFPASSASDPLKPIYYYSI